MVVSYSVVIYFDDLPHVTMLSFPQLINTPFNFQQRYKVQGVILPFGFTNTSTLMVG
jgi:hypothetical protein